MVSGRRPFYSVCLCKSTWRHSQFEHFYRDCFRSVEGFKLLICISEIHCNARMITSTLCTSISAASRAASDSSPAYYSYAAGKQWNPEKVVLVTQHEGDKLPSVVSRGSSLNGSAYQVPNKKKEPTSFPKVKHVASSHDQPCPVVFCVDAIREDGNWAVHGSFFHGWDRCSI